jgi:hypothetical protein
MKRSYEMNRKIKNIKLLSGLVIMLFMSGCQLRDIPPDIAVGIETLLDDAIDKLADQSEDWRATLEELESKLIEEGQDTLRNEVSNLISRSIAQAGVEFRCNVKFMGDYVRVGLIRIAAQFFGRDGPQVEPEFCNAVPIAVDRESVPDNVKQLEFYGYNFDQDTDLRVFLERKGLASLDVTDQLDIPTTFAMTLKFGAGGVQLDDKSDRFVLKCGGRKISSVAVIQPDPPVCETKTVRTPSQDVGPFVPPRVGGDRDFKGHGPRVNVWVEVFPEPTRVRAKVTMHAIETKSDFTEVSGSTFFDIFSPPAGFRITNIVSPSELRAAFSYTDRSHGADEKQLGAGGIVERVVTFGDTGGNEAGSETRVQLVRFNRMAVSLTQTGDCVLDTNLRALQADGMISAATLSHVMPAIEREEQRRRIELQRMGFRVLSGPRGLVVEP